MTALLEGLGIACEDVAEEKLPGLKTAVCEPLNFSRINAPALITMFAAYVVLSDTSVCIFTCIRHSQKICTLNAEEK